MYLMYLHESVSLDSDGRNTLNANYCSAAKQLDFILVTVVQY